VVFVLSDTVGAEDVLHTTPRAVTAAPPSDVIFPPPAAPVAVILLIVVVLSVGAMAEGVTEVDAVEAAEEPTELVATTVNV
jgi:hypothetical protein